MVGGDQQQLGQQSRAGRRRTRAMEPRDARYVESTPWAHLIMEYAYRARTPAHPRPLVAREIADRCGYTRHTVNAWLSRGVEPPISSMLEVISHLGISVEELIRVYAPADVAIPLSVAPPAAPVVDRQSAIDRQAQERAERERLRERQTFDGAEWALSLARAEASMRDAGIHEDAIASTLNHMRARMADTDVVSQLPQRMREEQRRGAPVAPSPTPTAASDVR